MESAKAMCGFCKQGKEVVDVCGHLYVTGNVAAHKKCMQYSAELIQYHHNIGFGGFKLEKVIIEMNRGNKLKCSLCKKNMKKGQDKALCRGATAGCSWKKCSKTFHYYCAATSEDVITRRMEVDKEQHKVVEYRIFCSQKHEDFYRAAKKKAMEHIRSLREESGSSGTEYEDDNPITVVDVEDHFETDSSSDSSGESERVTTEARRLKVKRARNKSDEVDSDSSEELKVKKKARMQSSKHLLKTAADLNDADIELAGDKLDRISGEELLSEDSSDDSSSVSKSKSAAQNGSTVPKTIGMLTPLPAEKAAGRSEHCSSPLKTFNSLNSDDTQSDSLNETSASELCLSEETDRILCFGEMDDIPVAFEKSLRRCVYKKFNIPGSSVCLWSHCLFKLTSKHIVYFLKDLSLALRQQEFQQFQQMVLSLKEEDVNKYHYIVELNQSYPEDLSSKLYSKLRDSIKENLLEASEQLDKVIGLYCQVKYKQQHICIAFLVLNNDTDPGGRIRKAMQKKISVYHWDDQTIVPAYRLNPSKGLQQKEYTILRQWLERIEEPFLDQRPWEPQMAGCQKSSVTVLLLKHFQKSIVSFNSSTHLIFIRPLDESIIRYSSYLEKLLSSLFHDEAEQTNIVVFDLQPEHRKLEDVLQGMPDNVNSQVITAFNPARQPISCVILKLRRVTTTEEQVASKEMTLVAREGNKINSTSDTSETSETCGDYIDMCEIIKEDPPTESIKFSPPDIKWRLLQCNKLGLKMVKICAENAISETRMIGIPSLTHKVQGDGNCFFRAMSQEITGKQNQYHLIRKKLIEYMLKHAPIFKKYFSMQDVQLYIEESDMAQNGTWATDTEIIAMATMLSTTIVIFTKVGNCYKWLPYNPLGGSSNHNCRVYLVNKGQHYDLVLDVQSVTS